MPAIAPRLLFPRQGVHDGNAGSATTEDPDTSDGLGGGAIAGIVVGVVLAVVIMVGTGFLWWRRRNKTRRDADGVEGKHMSVDGRSSIGTQPNATHGATGTGTANGTTAGRETMSSGSGAGAGAGAGADNDKPQRLPGAEAGDVAVWVPSERNKPAEEEPRDGRTRFDTSIHSGVIATAPAS